MKIHYTQSELLKRGWTPKIIESFLGEPDETAPNPQHERGARMKLYSASRVHSVEQSAPFQLDWDKLSQRRDKARIMSESKLHNQFAHYNADSGSPQLVNHKLTQEGNTTPYAGGETQSGK